MGSVGPAVVSIIAGILGVTIIAVLVSQKANTQSVITATGGALSGIIGAAVSPVTGNTSNQFGSTGIGFTTPFGSFGG